MNFDAAGREACVVRETRTNTPLQALDLMNDVTYLEASRKLAERVMKERRTSAEERIALAFRLATARLPDARAKPLCCTMRSRAICDDYKANPECCAEISQPGGIAAGRRAGRERAGGVFDARQPDPEHGRDHYEGVTHGSAARAPSVAGLTRRQFFGLASAGIGTAALATLLSDDLRAGRSDGGAAGLAAFRAHRQARDLPVSVGRAVADGHVRLQAAAARSARLGAAGLDPNGPAIDRHDLDAGDVSRWRRRSSSSRSTGSRVRGSASCCRTRRRSSTICASSSRCTPKPSITIPASRSSRQARSWPDGRASAHGFPTGWAARTTICLRSS